MSLNKQDWAVVAMGIGIKEASSTPQASHTAIAIAGHYQTSAESEKLEFLKDAKEGVEQAINLLQQAAEKVATEMAELNGAISPPPPPPPPPVRSRHDGEPPVTR